MSANRLKLNADKSELIWTGSRYNVSLLRSSGPSLQLGVDEINPNDHVRLLGVTNAADLCLDMHLATCFFCLRMMYPASNICVRPAVANWIFHGFVIVLLALGLYQSAVQRFGTHCLIRCVIWPSSLNVLGGTLKCISWPDIRGAEIARPDIARPDNAAPCILQGWTSRDLFQCSSRCSLQVYVCCREYYMIYTYILLHSLSFKKNMHYHGNFRTTNRLSPIHRWHTHSTRFTEPRMSSRHQCEASTWRLEAQFATVVRSWCSCCRCRFRRPWSCRC